MSFCTQSKVYRPGPCSWLAYPTLLPFLLSITLSALYLGHHTPSPSLCDSCLLFLSRPPPICFTSLLNLKTDPSPSLLPSTLSPHLTFTPSPARLGRNVNGSCGCEQIWKVPSRAGSSDRGSAPERVMVS